MLSQIATVADRVLVVAGKPRGRSEAFQRSIEEIRNGRSYQEFANALKTRTGIAFSRSYLKRVEDGSLGPNPLLIYALEMMAGRQPSVLLTLGAGASTNDLIRHSGTRQQGSPTSTGALDDPTAARIRELEDRGKEYEVVLRETQDVARKLLARLISIRTKGRPAVGTQPRRGGRHRKTG